MMTALEELQLLKDELPPNVWEDVLQRAMDWLASGGKEDDPYIHQQLRYAKHFTQNK